MRLGTKTVYHKRRSNVIGVPSASNTTSASVPWTYWGSTMFRLFRQPTPGEFFVVFGDCSQGGIDANFVQFGSKTMMDIPLVMQMQGVAAEATPLIRDALNWIYDKTKVKPIIALERNNGGASEMHNLVKFNDGKYNVYYMKDPQGVPNGDKPGYDTNVSTRPKMLGDWLKAYESKSIRIYDEETQAQHQTFIVNDRGRPEAAPNTHDDAVMSCAGLWQLWLSELPPRARHHNAQVKRLKLHV